MHLPFDSAYRIYSNDLLSKIRNEYAQTFHYNTIYKSKRLEIAQMFINRDRHENTKVGPHVRILAARKEGGSLLTQRGSCF